MGGRGGSSGMGGAVGNRFLQSLPDWQLRNIDSEFASLGNYGTKSSQIQFMKDNGVSDQTIDQMNSLLYNHGAGGSAQASADAGIVSHLQSNDDIGKALNMQVQMEEALYSRYMKSHPGANDTIYRAGNRKSGVESWTTNEEGADMGYGGIGWDHWSTIKDLRKQGYRILGGMGRHLGSPGESEVTMVKWR